MLSPDRVLSSKGMPIALFLALVPPLFWTAANVRSVSNSNSQYAQDITLRPAQTSIAQFALSQEDLYESLTLR